MLEEAENGVRPVGEYRGLGNVYKSQGHTHTKQRIFFVPAKDGIRSCVASRGLGDVFKGQPPWTCWRLVAFVVAHSGSK